MYSRIWLFAVKSSRGQPIKEEGWEGWRASKRERADLGGWKRKLLIWFTKTSQNYISDLGAYVCLITVLKSPVTDKIFEKG